MNGMTPWNKHEYDDAWILERWKDVHNWSVLCKEYNNEHSTDICYSTFKYHCNHDLGLTFRLTKEQDDWLKEYYPHNGRVKTAKALCEKFGIKMTAGNVSVYCRRHFGLKVTKQRRKEIPIENSGRCHPIGTVKVMGDMGMCVKTKDGWIRLADMAVGKAPKGYKNIHLDGNIENNEPSNIVTVSNKQWAMMSSNGFWTNDAELTKTGLVWCELKEAHEARKRSGK